MFRRPVSAFIVTAIPLQISIMYPAPRMQSSPLRSPYEHPRLMNPLLKAPQGQWLIPMLEEFESLAGPDHLPPDRMSSCVFSSSEISVFIPGIPIDAPASADQCLLMECPKSILKHPFKKGWLKPIPMVYDLSFMESCAWQQIKAIRHMESVTVLLIFFPQIYAGGTVPSSDFQKEKRYFSFFERLSTFLKDT